jgi:transcriptional regulator with XRE-family HTH domain
VLSDVVGEQLLRVRKHLGVTRKELAKTCKEDLDWPSLTEGVIGTIETGRRDKETGARKREVSVDEVAVIARALNVPPLLLITPLGYEDTIEALPGKTVSTLHAYKWWSGESILDGVSGPDPAVTTFKDYEQAVLEYMGSQMNGDERATRKAWTRIQTLQKTMQSFGWRIPAFPETATGDQA